MVTTMQKRTAQAIVSVFENGAPRLGYGTVTALAGDTGGLSYGRFQTTLASGGLFRLIRDYCAAAGSRFRDPLQAYLDRLRQKDPAVNTDPILRQLLIEAGADPVMQLVQQSFFDRHYWDPAIEQARRLTLGEPLSVCAVFDSHVHGSWTTLRKRVESSIGNPAQTDERNWITTYLQTRRTWLANHRNPVLHPTVYRMDSLLGLANGGNWSLELPLRVHGVTIKTRDLVEIGEKLS